MAILSVKRKGDGPTSGIKTPPLRTLISQKKHYGATKKSQPFPPHTTMPHVKISYLSSSHAQQTADHTEALSCSSLFPCQGTFTRNRHHKPSCLITKTTIATTTSLPTKPMNTANNPSQRRRLIHHHHGDGSTSTTTTTISGSSCCTCCAPRVRSYTCPDCQGGYYCTKACRRRSHRLQRAPQQPFTKEEPTVVLAHDHSLSQETQAQWRRRTTMMV